MQRDLPSSAIRAALAGRLRAVRRTARHERNPLVTLAVLAGLVAIVILVSLNMGFIRLSPLDVGRTLLGAGSERQETILYDLRLPRIVLAVLIGAALATSGAILQGVTQNPLADPGILGINAGAGTAVLLLLAMTQHPTTRALEAPPFALPVAALGGGLSAALLVYLVAYKDGIVTPSRLLLVGVAVGIGASAATPLIARRIDRNLYEYAVRWMEGSLAGTSWTYVMALAPWVLLLVPLALYRGHLLNVISLGDSIATGLGVAVERERRVFVLIAVGLAASAVAIGGGIAFVGLIGPHVGRRLVGPNYRLLLPAAALVGMLLLIVADLIARNALAPFEMPVGIVVAVIGAPYFLFLLARSTG